MRIQPLLAHVMFAVMLVGLLSAAQTITPTPSPTPPAEPDWWQPDLDTSWQIQYTDEIDLSLEVDLYNLDGFDTEESTIKALHERDVKVACYINAGAYEDWRPDAEDFPESVLGKDMEGWPGERWLDIRDIETLAPIMRARMQMCKDKGFDTIDPDNINGYVNDTGFPLTAEDQVNFNIWLTTEAHGLGMSIGLKNAGELAEQLWPYFDWALNEQCFSYDECDYLTTYFVENGKAAFVIEYELTTEDFCPPANAANFNALHKNLVLDAYRTACR
jgi:hypothetical protein